MHELNSREQFFELRTAMGAILILRRRKPAYYEDRHYNYESAMLRLNKLIDDFRVYQRLYNQGRLKQDDAPAMEALQGKAFTLAGYYRGHRKQLVSA